MASKARQQKRRNKPVTKGNHKPKHHRKTDESKMNAGGFYAGMPGVEIDEWGNRKMINIVVKPNGYTDAILFAHPKFIKTAVQDAMTNDMVRGIMHSAVLDQVFSKKTIWNWLLRMRLKTSLHIHHKRMEKKMREKQAEMFKQMEEDSDNQ